MRSGVLEENSGKVPAKLLEKIPNREYAINSGILGTGKGKPAANHWGDTALDLVPTLCAECFEIDSYSLLEFF